VLGVETKAPVRVCKRTWRKWVRAQGARANAIKVFTIAFGYDADKTVLEAIANPSDRKQYDSSLENIPKIYDEIATFS
jgi:hypothetical protein